MTGCEQLRCLLAGGVPDAPPHFEMMFQLGAEWFGLTPETPDLDIRLPLRCIEEFGYAAVSTNLPSLARLKREVGPAALVFTFNGGGLIQMPPGDQVLDFSVRLYEQPEELHAQARRDLEAAKELARQEVDWGVDFLIQNTDFGYNTQPFLSPAHFREFVVPYMAEFVDFVHGLGIPMLMHSDGHITELLPDIVSTGIDGYQSIDPQGGMDIRAVRAAYPDWLLMGNVPCNLLQDVEEDRIRASVRYCLEHGGIGKRYIFSTSNVVFAGMPPESYRIMLDEYRRCVAAARVPARGFA